MKNFAEDALRTMHTAYLAGEESGTAVQMNHVFQGLLHDESAVGQMLAPAQKAFSASLTLLGKAAIPKEIVIVDLLQRMYQSNLALSPDVLELDQRATGLANRWQHHIVNNVHLLHSLLGMDCPELEPLLQDFGLDKYELMAQCLTILKRISPQTDSAALDRRMPSSADTPDASLPALSPPRDEAPPKSEVTLSGWFTGRKAYRPLMPNSLKLSSPAETSSVPSDWMIEEVLDTISSAIDFTSRDNSAIHPDHLLAALLNNPKGPVAESLKVVLDLEELRKRLRGNLEVTSYPPDSQLFSNETMAIVEGARSRAAELGRRKVTMRDLFFASLPSQILLPKKLVAAH
jgi:hypothetical protein